MHLHIAFSSDNNYVQHLGVAMVSLLENNKEMEAITVHILDNGITEDSQNKLKRIATQYKRNIKFYQLESLLATLQTQNIPNTIAIAAYSRLFLPMLLDASISEIIYADCDAIFESSLQELLTIDKTDCTIAGVEDHVGPANKTAIGIPADARYINSGFLYMNLKKMREHDATTKMLDFIKKYNGNVQHHDQGVINGIYHNDIYYLPPRYNAMTSFWEFKNANEMEAYYGASAYYPDNMLVEAKNNPVFVHFTPGFSKRPWVKNCRHPLRNRYHYYKSLTPWKAIPLQPDKRSLKFKMLDFIFNTFGSRFYKGLFK